MTSIDPRYLAFLAAPSAGRRPTLVVTSQHPFAPRDEPRRHGRDVEPRHPVSAPVAGVMILGRSSVPIVLAAAQRADGWSEIENAIERTFGSDETEFEAELAALRSRHSPAQLAGMLRAIDPLQGNDEGELLLFRQAAGGRYSAADVKKIVDHVDRILGDDQTELVAAGAAFGNRALTADEIGRVVSKVDDVFGDDKSESQVLSAAFRSNIDAESLLDTMDMVDRRFSDDRREMAALVNAFSGYHGGGFPSGGTSPGDDPLYADPGYPSL